jgi:hypothetical protein
MDPIEDSTAMDVTRPTIVGHLVIRDPESGEVFVNQRTSVIRPLEENPLNVEDDSDKLD